MEFNCFWSHNCNKTKICCHFCHEENCEHRCYDDPRNCRYKESKSSANEYVKEPEIIVVQEKLRKHNEVVDNNLRFKLKDYRLKNKLKIEAFAKIIEIDRQLLQRVLSDLPIVKIRTDSYNRLKEWARNNLI